MDNKQKPTQNTNGLATDTELIKKAQTFATNLNPKLREYLILGAGIILVLFSLGYIQFINLIIGAFGLVLIVWAARQTGIIDIITNQFEKLLSWFQKK